jgi:hypothetical protein
VLFAGLPIVTPGHIGRTESLHSGTALVTAAVGSDGALAEVKGRVSVLRGGTVGTSQILLSVSLDDGTSYKTARLGTALTYTIPYIGVTLTLESGGTLVAGDEIFVFETTAPAFDSTGVTLAKTKMEASQYVTRTWLFVGDQSTLVGAQAIETRPTPTRPRPSASSSRRPRSATVASSKPRCRATRSCPRRTRSSCSPRSARRATPSPAPRDRSSATASRSATTSASPARSRTT